MQRADCDAHKSRRICALPITMLLADRFSRISAPAAAPAALGGDGTQRSSQISMWNVNGGGTRCREDQVGAERRLVPGDGDRSAAHALAGGEMPPLVEFAVIRQEDFRHDPEHMAAVDRDRAIVEPPLPPQRRPDDKDRTQVFACRDQPLDLRLYRIEHRVLEQQIVDRIGRQRQLGKHHQRDPRRVAVAQERQRLVAVPGRLGDGDLRHARADPHELVTVRGKEGRHRTGCSRFGRLIAAPIWRFANGFVRGGGRHRAVRPGAQRDGSCPNLAGSTTGCPGRPGRRPLSHPRGPSAHGLNPGGGPEFHRSAAREVEKWVPAFAGTAVWDVFRTSSQLDFGHF